MRWLLGSPGITRMAQDRFSIPQTAAMGAKMPGTSRLNEFTLGASIKRSSGINACMPPTKWRIVLLMPCGALASWNSGLSCLSRNERWTWPLCPSAPFDQRAMKVIIRSRRCATALA